MTRRAGPARWPLYALALFFVALGVVALLQRGEDDGDETPDAAVSEEDEMIVPTTTVPTEDVDGEPAPISITRASYRLTYRIEGFTADGGAIIDLEHRAVRPPYASRVETVPEGDDAASFLQISGFGVLHTGREGEVVSVLVAEPTVAPGDARVDIDIDAALAAGLLEWRHQQRTILGRRCQVFRAGSPIDIAELAPQEEDDWADLCIGDDGLVLQEEWVIGGDPFRRRTVVDLEVPVSIDDDELATDEPDDSPMVGRLAELTPDSRPPGVAHYELALPPAGFHHRGRFGYSPPRGQSDPTKPDTAKVAVILDVFEDGSGAFVTVANGGTSDNSTLVEVGEDDAAVDLGHIGVAGVVLGLRQNELRVGFARGRFLRVYGTLPVAELATLARSLRVINDPDGAVTAM